MKWFALPSAFLGILCAQEGPAFEVASVRANKSTEVGQSYFDLKTGGRLVAQNVVVWDLIRHAFGLRDSQMTGGPAWVKSDGFDIQATPSTSAGIVERPRALQMLQSLLVDRFHLRWHYETREMTIYALRIASGGPKLKPASEGQPGRIQMGDIRAPRLTLEALCQILEHETRRLVVDETGLHGSYAIELQWARDIVGGTSELDTSRPSLFGAVKEQLGLRLDSSKLPVKVFVIDELQRPGEN